MTPIAGRYEILRELGRGAMGIVYLAHDTTLDRDVALKELRVPPGLTDEQRTDMASRFVREARAAGRLTHPSIVAVYDAFSEGGRDYIAMEYLEGRALSELIDTGSLSPAAAGQITLQVLDAVGAAHAAGVVHRDLKPDNIFVLPDGRAKVADFGIAKVAETGATMTQAGTVMGTPGYMAPEQVRGEPVDHRADLFAIGVILYEMLAGSNPFLADSPTTIMYRIVHEEPPVLTVPAATGMGHLGAVARKAMAKLPADRYAQAAAMAEDIRTGTAPAPIAAASASTVTFAAAPTEAAPRSKTGVYWVVGGILAIGVVVLLVAAMGGRGSGGGVTAAATIPSAASPQTDQVMVSLTEPGEGAEVRRGEDFTARVSISGADSADVLVEASSSGNSGASPVDGLAGQASGGVYDGVGSLPFDGQYDLTAVATLADGTKVTSPAVHITVVAPDVSGSWGATAPPYWAAFIGAYNTQAEAEAQANRARAKGAPGTVFVLDTRDYSSLGSAKNERAGRYCWNAGCAFGSKAEAQAAVGRLRKLGFSAYVKQNKG